VALARAPQARTMPARTLHRLGKALEEVGDFNQAARLLVEAQRLYPDDFWINAEVACALDKSTPPQPVAAARLATVAAALRNDNEALHYNLGYYLERIGESDHAIAAYRRAAELHPGHLGASANLNRMLMRTGDTETAIAVFQQSVMRRPDVAELHYYLGA